MDKIRAMPVVDKLLSLRRNNSPQQQQQQHQMESMEDVPLPVSSDIAERKEPGPPPKGRKMSVSGSESTEPQVNRRRDFYPPGQYMSTLKTLLAVVLVCTLFGTIPLYRQGQKMSQGSSLKVIMLWNEDLDKMSSGSAHMECGCVVTTHRRHSERAFDAVVFNADKPYSSEI